MNFSSGQTIGQYSIVKRIGSGGMAIVYLATHEKLGRDVAIKVMHQGFQDDSDLLERFQREAKVVARLDHPHIVPVYDFDEFDGLPYLVMKYIEGRTLKWHMRKQVLSLDEISTICGAIADALTYAHKEGVLHRDVKPGNVMLNEAGTPYLTDFGLVRIVAQGESSLSAGMIVGTPHYISPEQAIGTLEMGPEADVYSLGVMLYEMVVGHVPFAAESPHAIIHDHIYTPPPMPSEANPEIPIEVESVLLKSLEKMPENRYSSPNDLMGAFHNAIQASGLRALSEDRSEIAARSIASMRKAKPIQDVLNDPPVIEPPVPKGTTEFEFNFGDIGKAMREAMPQVGDVINQAKDALFNAQGKHAEEAYTAPTEDELETQIQQRVQKRLKARRGFGRHAFIFIIINIIVIIIGTTVNDGIAAAIMGDASTGVASFLAENPTPSLETLMVLAETDPQLAQHIAETRIGLVATSQPWGVIFILFWAGGLAAHHLHVRGLSARAEHKRDKLLLKKLEIEHGKNWENRITKGQYAKTEKRVQQRTCKVRGFWQHAAVFFWVNLGLIAVWQMVEAILWRAYDYAQVMREMQSAIDIEFAASRPFVLAITLLWGVGLFIHAITVISSRGSSMEHELARERSLTHSRRTPRPDKRKHDDDAENNLKDHEPLPVRFGSDGELTNSTVDAWEKAER